MNQGRLLGKRCLLVGGTGGLGSAASQRFLTEGARVLAVGAPEVDATRPDEVANLFDRAVSELGGLDVLYHLAGGSGRRHGDGPLHECTDAGWHATLALNLTSVFLTNRAAVSYWLREGRPGVILNVSSVLGLSPSPGHFATCAYAAAKGAIMSFSRQAAAQYAPHGIRVNVLAPGLIDTPMSQRAVKSDAIAAYLKVKQPLASGPGHADDCTGAAVFLCSDEARLVTGLVLTVDGGWCVSEPPG
jgi:NAD(P)-dependent dehydrogenase (short-subunit alcohol dehydrogenase family)